MRLDHQHNVASVRNARAGFTIMEVLLALSLTVVIIGVMFAGVLAYSRANTANMTLEGLNVTAKVIEDHLTRDLALISRNRTFPGAAQCPLGAGPNGSRLYLMSPETGGSYRVDYSWSRNSGRLERMAGVGAPAGNDGKRFEGVTDFFISCLEGGQVTATATVRERLDGVVGEAGQQVEVRVTAPVRMR